ncbi:hypothetical protein ABFS83_08G173600 [Erythranthe nasuta]
MKVTVERTTASREIQRPPNPPPPSDLSDKPIFPRKPPRRKTRAPGAGVRLKRDPSAKRSSRPETPLLRWKFEEPNVQTNSVEEEEKSSGEAGRKINRRRRAVVSARKLGAGLWRLGLPEVQANDAQKLGLQSGGGGHFGANIHCHNFDRVHNSSVKDPVHSPHSGSGLKHGLPYKFEPPFQFPNPAMEGATKWDPHGWRASTSHETKQIFNQPSAPKNQESAAAVISTLQSDLEQARSRINYLENERRSSKKKLEQFLHELSEERSAWRSREHEKIRAIIDDMKSDLSREKKTRQKLEIVNSKLVKELSDTKLSAKRYLQEYEKERKARELIEEVCDELAKEIGEDKAEVEALKRESMKLREEVDEERKMLQMAEVWREERVQMKLVDAKVMLEDKYSQMTVLVEKIESFLNSRNPTSDSEEIKKADFLRQVAASVDMGDVREITYEPPNPDDIFSMFEDANFGEANERDDDIESKIHRVSPEEKMLNKEYSRKDSNVYTDRSGELEEDASEWETVSHRGSSYSPDGNFSRNGGEETPTMEIGEVGDDDVAKTRKLRKGSSESKMWRSSYSSNGDSYNKIVSIGRFSNGRVSSGAHGMASPDCGGGFSPREYSGQWSSPDLGNPHVNRAMKGCIEWPRGPHKNSLKARLMEARMESQKVQLRQVLKQKF